MPPASFLSAVWLLKSHIRFLAVRVGTSSPDDARLEVEPLGHRQGERGVDGLERAERRRIALGVAFASVAFRALPIAKRRSGGVSSARRADSDRWRLRPAAAFSMSRIVSRSR